MQNETECILIEDTKDFILFTVRRFIDNKDIENEILKKYKSLFDFKVNKIKRLNRIDTVNSIHFKYENQLLYFVDCEDNKNFAEFYNKFVKPTETIDMQRQKIETLLECFINDLRCIIYNEGYDMILKKIQSFIKTHKWDIQIIPHYFAMGMLYGRPLNLLLNRIYSYKDLLEEKVKGFSFEEWDAKRTIKDIENLDMKTAELFEKVSSKNEEDIAKFLDEYFKWVVKVSEKTCNDLAELVKANNIKFN